MTKRRIDFTKMATAIESCKVYQQRKEEREKDRKKLIDLECEVNHLNDKLKERIERPQEIDGFGILSYVNCYRYYSRSDDFDYSYEEARIENITENELIVSTDYNNFYKIPISDIKEKGYYYCEEYHLIFVDRIDNSARFKEIIDIIVRQRKSDLLEDIKRQKEYIKKYQDDLKKLEDLLPQYDDYKIGNVDKIGKRISFALGLDYKEIEEFENDFPRVYKV